jgi:hypothetical protein
MSRTYAATSRRSRQTFARCATVSTRASIASKQSSTLADRKSMTVRRVRVASRRQIRLVRIQLERKLAWALSLQVATTAGILGAMARGFSWI